MVRAWEFIDEAININQRDLVYDTLKSSYAIILLQSYHYYDDETDHYETPASSLYGAYELNSIISDLEHLSHKIKSTFPNNRSLSKLCQDMIDYFNG